MPVWQPGCDIAHLQLRAQLLASIRAFFAEKSVLEVETPLLGAATGTDPQLDFFATQLHGQGWPKVLYLQSSPEFAMKRLLAAGSGSIYQICKAFRNGEAGRLHNPEFTILEWYRVGFDLSQLMQEVAELMTRLFAPYRPLSSVRILSYSEVFERYTGLDALSFDFDRYRDYSLSHNLEDAPRLCGKQHSLWLDFIFSHQVQPYLGMQGLTMVHSYPACQAALAKINQDDQRVADRVELFVQGVELGNGFFELTDAVEQERRFEYDQAQRAQHNLPPVTKDAKFLAALNAGLPGCSGIAVGLDRLLMLLNSDAGINEVLTFSIDRI